MEPTNKWKKKTRLYYQTTFLSTCWTQRLQEQILNRKKLDLDVKNAMKTLMKEGPTSLKNNLEDWKIEEIDR
jgi:hypothetical protein